MRKETKLWTTKDGTKIRICDMTDDHLLNTIRFLDKKAVEHHASELQAAYSCSTTFSPDSMASYYCDQEISTMEEDGPDPYQYFLLYENLVNEALRRDLKI